MSRIESDAAVLLQILASTDIGIQNGIVAKRALEQGIETEPLEAALVYAGNQNWIQNGPHGTLELTVLGRAKANQS